MDEQVHVNEGASRSKKPLFIIAIIVIVALLWLLTGGFGKMALKKAGIDVDYGKDGSVTYTNEEGTAVVGGNTLPDNWPSDAPTYPNASIQYSASSNPQTGADGSAVVFVTNDTTQTIVDFYKKELVAKGWTIEQTATLGTATVLAGLKDTRTFGVYITDAGNGQTSVTIAIEIK